MIRFFIGLKREGVTICLTSEAWVQADSALLRVVAGRQSDALARVGRSEGWLLPPFVAQGGASE